jgi:predicted flap endonuclease-1-like 5' DNA nuclease
MVDAEETERRSVDDPTELKYVGPATADAIEAAGFAAQAVADKEVSYRMLLEAGINPGVAAKIRRHHSLAWSFDNDGDLDRRSAQVRGLQDEEAAWVASSSIGDDEESAEGEVEDNDAEADGESAWVADSAGKEAAVDGVEADSAGDQAAEDEAAWVASATDGDSDESATADGSGDPLAAEAAWRERSKPTPLTEISGVGESYSERLAEAGVTSIRSLATASPELLSDVTGIDEERLRRWHSEASEIAD